MSISPQRKGGQRSIPVQGEIQEWRDPRVDVAGVPGGHGSVGRGHVVPYGRESAKRVEECVRTDCGANGQCACISYRPSG